MSVNEVEMLASSPNKLRAKCSCGTDVYPQEGFWVPKLKQVWCAVCWQKEAERQKAFDQKKAVIAELPASLRPKVRLYWNAIAKRVIARTLDRVSNAMFETFKACCESGGCTYDGGPGGMGYNGTLGIVPELMRLLEKGGLRTEVSDNLADALNSRATETTSAIAGAGVRIVASARRGKKLKDYQKIGVEFLAARTSALLSDDIGLGKSATVLKAIPANGRTVIIAPKIVLGTIKKGKAIGGWAEEAAIWRPDLKVVIFRKQSEFRWPEPGEIVLLNYELMPVSPDEVAKAAAKASKKRQEAIKKKEAIDAKDEEDLVVKRQRIATEPPIKVVLVIDEAHALANANSKRSIRFRHMSFRVLANDGRVYAVTATPTKNEPKELWNILECIGASQASFGTFQNYAKLHDYKPRQVGKDRMLWEFGEPSPEVAERLRRVMLRRKKRDVLTELPPITVRRLVIDVDRETVKVCDAALSAIERAGLDVEKAMEIVDETRAGFDFTMISRALEALARVKAPYVLERATEYERAGTPVVFFAAHLSIVEALGARKGWGALVGGDKASINLDGEPKTMKGPEVARAFFDGKIDHVAATIQYAGAGLNGLQRASELFLAEKLWNPAMNSQAVGRIDRLGQKNPMTVTDLVADHPLDLRMSEVLEKKLELYAATIDAAAVAPEDLTKRENVADELAEAAKLRTKGGK